MKTRRRYLLLTAPRDILEVFSHHEHTSMIRQSIYRRTLCTLAACLPLAFVGCPKTDKPKVDDPKTTSLPTDAELKARLDTVIDFSSTQRHLNTKDHSAWQVVHGILAYGRGFQIEHEGKLVSALDYLQAGGKLNGWNMRKGPHGIIAIVEPGSKSGQGHPDQWLGYLSQCGLPADQKLLVDGQEFTVQDLISQAQWDIYDGMEATWTLMALSKYLPMDTKWQAKDGGEWTIDRIVEMETKAELGGSACGGTHRLYGIISALNRHKQEGGSLEGAWKLASDKFYAPDGIVAKVREYQLPDGCFSNQFFDRSGRSDDIETRIHATGHTLEVLCMALDDEQLKQPWVTNGAVALVDMLERTKEYPLECGALYHAARALELYRTRRFGPRVEDAATKS